MRNSIYLILLFPFLLGTISGDNSDKSLMSVKESLGLEVPGHYRPQPSEEQVRIGYQLVHEGRADLASGKSKYISKFYACTSCHNTVREDPDLTKVDPEQRLKYAIEHNLPYLQASTFWGIVNRTEWYNDDYVKKYGDLVIAANTSLEASIQLCAQECSQGRELEDWEMEAILSYLSTLEVMMADLDLSDKELGLLDSDETEAQTKLQLIDSKYLARSPATFVDPPSDKESGYPLQGRAEMGESIYALSCQHCHREDGESDLVLDNAKKTFRWLRRNFTKDSRYSLYEIVRKGTYAEYGHREYMPHYTLEKMSHQQVEDLRAYIEQQAK